MEFFFVTSQGFTAGAELAETAPRFDVDWFFFSVEIGSAELEWTTDTVFIGIG